MNFGHDLDDDIEIRYEDFFTLPEEYEKNKGKRKDLDQDNEKNINTLKPIYDPNKQFELFEE
jgi:hypothetical protein